MEVTQPSPNGVYESKVLHGFLKHTYPKLQYQLDITFDLTLFVNLCVKGESKYQN